MRIILTLSAIILSGILNSCQRSDIDVLFTGFVNSFAGTVNYLTRFESDGKCSWLTLNRLNKGVAEVFINGKSAGVCWYGKPVFRINSLVQTGTNTLEIKYNTILSNYVMTLKDNPTAVRWTEGYTPVIAGPGGKVVIYK